MGKRTRGYHPIVQHSKKKRKRKTVQSVKTQTVYQGMSALATLPQPLADDFAELVPQPVFKAPRLELCLEETVENVSVLSPASSASTWSAQLEEALVCTGFLP